MKKLTKTRLRITVMVLGGILIAEIFAFMVMINSGNSYTANLNLGNKYLLEMDYENAIDAFSKAIEIDGMSADAYIGRGDAYLELGDYSRAWADYEKAEEVSGRNDILSGKIPERSIHVTAFDGTPLSGAEVSLESDAHSYSLKTDTSGNASGIMFPDTYSVTVRRDDYQESAQTYMTTVTFNGFEDTVKDIIIDSVEDYPYEVGDNVWARIEDVSGVKTLLFYSRNGTLRWDWKETVGFKNLESINAIAFGAGSGTLYLPENSSFLFSNHENYTEYDMQSLQTIDASKMDTSKVTNMQGMFRECYGLTSLDLSSFNTRNVTNMAVMFCHCDNLESLKVGSFDTSNVVDMSHMFRFCRKLKELDLSSFNTKNVTDMSYLFAACESLETLDLSSFDTINVTSMVDMFYCCRSLTSLDLRSFNTSNVTGMVYMFDACNSLTSLDVSSFNTSGVIAFDHMFGSCNSLRKLDLSNFDTSNAEDMFFMFGECNSLQELNLSSFDMSKVTEATNMFKNCNELQILKTPKISTGWGELPIAMYDSAGTKYTSLPILSESFVLAKTQELAKSY